MSTVKQWAERVIRVVEGGTTAKRIRLTTEGTVWETWESPFPTVDEFTEQAEALITSLAEELPTRKVQLILTAEDGTGAALSTLPRTVVGKNKNAGQLGDAQHAKAQADAMASLASTMETILRLARMQCETSGAQLEKQAQQIHDLIELNRARQEASLLETEQTNTAQQQLIQTFTESAPMLLQALGAAITKPKTPLVAVPPIAPQK